MMRRRVIEINFEDDPEAFLSALTQRRQTADEWRQAHAEGVRKQLDRAAAKRGTHIKAFVFGLPEDDGFSILWEWLCTYKRLMRERSKATPDIALIVEHAEELGRIDQKFQWRAGRDFETGERREALALQSRKSRLALAGDRDGGRASANKRRHDEAEAWRTVAREVAATSPVGGARLEKRILEELRRRGFGPRSGPAIRKAIKGVRGRPVG